jgi:hypothetical protein
MPTITLPPTGLGGLTIVGTVGIGGVTVAVLSPQ